MGVRRVWKYSGHLAIVGIGLMLGLASPVTAHAQTGAITGVVTDSGTTQPVAGVQVSIPERKQGSITNGEGRYTINAVPAGTHTVSFRQLGYKPATRQVTVRAGASTTLSVAMTATVLSLDQMVITASGETRKRTIGAAVSVVDASVLQAKTGAKSIGQLLEGAATGVDITQSTGTVGAAINVRIRGNTSINLSNMPIVYIDGARINTKALGLNIGGGASDRFLDISPDEIQNIEIVKGPAAATLYGTDAAAGVIRITTKRGTSSQGSTSLKLDVGQQWDDNRYADRAWNPSVNLNGGGYKDTTYYINSLKGSADMPNQRAFFDPFRVGNMYNVALATRGGTGTFGYYVGYDQARTQGVLTTNGQQKHNLQSNVNFEPFRNTSLNVSTSYTSSRTKFNFGDGESWGLIGAPYFVSPMDSPINAVDPTTGGAKILTCPRAVEEARKTGTSLAAMTGSMCNYANSFAGNNTFDRLETMDLEQGLERFTGSATLTQTLGKALATRLTVGYDNYSEGTIYMIPNVPLKVLDGDPQRTVTDAQSRALTLEGSSTYTLDLTKQLNSQTTVGVQWYQTAYDAIIGSSVGFPPGTGTLGNGSTRSSDENLTDVRTLGYYVQEQIGWRNKLFVTPAIRWDRNSAFGPNLGAVAYPKFGASYVISEESWFPKRFLNELRLRSAWGTSGKQPGPFDAMTILSTTTVTTPTGAQVGFAPKSLGNDNLKPERGEEVEMGFDAKMLDSRLRLEFTSYHKRTTDALVLRPLPPSTGFAAGQWDNIGSIVNKGLEVGIDADLLQNRFLRWNSHLNYTRTNSVITKLDVPVTIGVLQQDVQGHAYGAYFMFPVSLDANNKIVIGPKQIDVGHPTPDYNGSLSNTISIFNDRLSFFTSLAFQGGNKIVNWTEEFQCRAQIGNCPAKYERDAAGQPTKEAILKSSPAATNQPYLFVYDAGFVRLRTASLSYLLPVRVASPVGASSATLTLAATNLHLWTSYPGTDPEANSQGRQNAASRDFFTLGQPRSFTVSVRLGY